MACVGFAQDKAQDADRRLNNQNNQSYISPQGEVDPYMPFPPNWSKSSNQKPPLWYRHAEKNDILGKWEFVGIPNSTIEFKSDSLEHTFYFYDDAIESGSGGKWSGSYYDDILIVTLRHLEIDVTEKLAVRGINRKTLALGSIEDGKFVYRYRIKKQ